MIKVTGKGKISVRPDRIRLVIHLKDSRKNYEETLQQSAVQVEALRDSFVKLGFEGTALKTTFFHISAKYENVQAMDKSWKRKFKGYEFRHDLKLEFDIDNKKLGKILYVLAHNPSDPEFQITYTVKDAEGAKNLLLKKAVEDSKGKAEILAQAAGVSLGEVVTIDYSWEEIELVASPLNRMAEACRGITMSGDEDDAYDMNVEPDDIEVSDHVTVIWAIRQM
jgi:hypothetical protein